MVKAMEIGIILSNVDMNKKKTLKRLILGPRASNYCAPTDISSNSRKGAKIRDFVNFKKITAANWSINKIMSVSTALILTIL